MGDEEENVLGKDEQLTAKCGGQQCVPREKFAKKKVCEFRLWVGQARYNWSVF